MYVETFDCYFFATFCPSFAIFIQSDKNKAPVALATSAFVNCLI